MSTLKQTYDEMRSLNLEKVGVHKIQNMDGQTTNYKLLNSHSSKVSTKNYYKCECQSSEFEKFTQQNLNLPKHVRVKQENPPKEHI